MADVNRTALNLTVTVVAGTPLGQPGPFVLVRRQMDDGDIVNDFYTPEAAQWLAGELTKAAREATS
ncbi:hypothetical protein GCM10010399_44060 [Dactylosporangium fulvum]|uniref:Uncharacterized protein n=1 Tax=Dactylosporangium fulvum TaxID=53359 RepID=A0ABY5W753_9ACTN|nr:hypothetical protein [Dactylosporangium fulvum]UWP85927.1 hypothetical protein Dfulv_17410 [Dactylosporangium fulvum]